MYHIFFKILTKQLVLISLFAFNNVYAQFSPFIYKDVKNSQHLSLEDFYNEHRVFSIPKESKNSYHIKAHEISSNAKKNTKHIQEILNKYENVVFPEDKAILISIEGLKIPSNRSLYFKKGAIIKFTGIVSTFSQDILKINRASNVRVFNAKIQGSRKISNAQKGEWSAGISIIDSENVVIENAFIYDTWGDGIAIGSRRDGCTSKNITIKNVWIDNVRRNGISINSVVNAEISNVLVSNINGALPECGVDVEPDYFGSLLQNINFNNFYGYNVNSVIFNVNLSALNSDTRQYQHHISIKLENFKEESSYSFIGINFNNYKKKYTPIGKFEMYNGRAYTKEQGINFNKIKTNSNVRVIYENVTK